MAIRELSNVETFADEILANHQCTNTIVNSKNTFKVTVGQIYDWIERNFNKLKIVQGNTKFNAQKSKLLNNRIESHADIKWLDNQLFDLVKYYKGQMHV